MATAPPESRLPLFTSDLPLPPHFRAHASPFYSPAPNTPSDSGYSWTSISTSMPPQHEASVTPQPNSQSPVNMTKAKRPSESGGGGLKFITATSNLKEFRKKENMTTVRKQAMDHHLTSEGKEPRRRSKAKSRPPLNNVPSDASSVVSQDMTVASSAVATMTSFTATSRASASGSHGAYATSDSASSIGRLILEAAPIVEPSRQGPLPYDAIPPPLFQSIGKALDPFGTMFQASHPKVSVEHLKKDCSVYFGTKSLGIWWIPTALSHPHTFLGTLCLATAYNDVMKEYERDSVQTTALRQEVIHLVGRKLQIPSENIADHNFMAVIQLIISEIISRQDFALQYHLGGIEKMISLRGGLSQMKELDGRLANSITWICIASSILHEERPKSFYLDHATANSKRLYQAATTIPESPIYLPLPRTSYQTLEQSKSCSARALELMAEVRIMVDIFLHETKQARRNSDTIMNIYRRITNSHVFPPISELPRPLKEADYRYEAMRITAIIQATAIANSIPLSKAIHQVLGLEQRMLPFLNTYTDVMQSHESFVSPNELRRHSQGPDFATSPFSPCEVSPTWTSSSSYFSSRAHRSSVSSIAMTHRSSQSSIVTRPSVSAAHSSGSLPCTSPSVESAPSEFKFNHTKARTSTNVDLLLKEIRDAISISNMSQCWEGMAGVLLWIGMVIGAATKDSDNKILRKFFSAITMRSGIMLCFEHPEAINATVLRMTEIIEKLDDKQQSSSPSSNSSRVTKRQKS